MLDIQPAESGNGVQTTYDVRLDPVSAQTPDTVPGE